MTYRQYPHRPRHTPGWTAYKAAVAVGLLVVVLVAVFR